MTMDNVNEFNNNNYLSGFYEDMNSGTYPHMVTQLPSRGVAGHNFTFTFPTQCNTVMTPRPSIQTTSPMGYMSAPGVGTTWQHSIPTTMPWTTSSAVQATAFKVMSSYSEPVPSCSSPVNRPKRKALNYPDDTPNSKVYLCADQFANLKISSIVREESSKSMDDGGRNTFSCSGSLLLKDKDGWNRFHEVENSLQVDQEDMNRETVVKEHGPVLHIDKNLINKPTYTGSNSILPKTVVEDINKPCMQVVLWRSPGERFRDFIQDDTSTTTSSVMSSPSPVTSSIINNSSASSHKLTHQTNSRFPLTSRDNFMDEMPCGLESPTITVQQPTLMSSHLVGSDRIWPLSGFANTSSTSSYFTNSMVSNELYGSGGLVNSQSSSDLGTDMDL